MRENVFNIVKNKRGKKLGPWQEGVSAITQEKQLST